MNRLLNEEIGLHKGIFTFMNRLKTTIFESGFSFVAQANAGVLQKNKATVAAQKLTERAAEAEKEYRDGTRSATDLLRLVAVHYDDGALVELFNNMTEAEDDVDEDVQDLDLEDDSQESG